MRIIRLLGLGAVLGLLTLLMACGSDGGGGTNGGTDLIPVDGFRRFETSPLSGAGLQNATVTVDVTDSGQGRATSAADLVVLLTSSDGLFSQSRVTVTALTANRIEGRVTSTTDVEYNVVIVFSADGASVSVSLTRVSDGASVESNATAVIDNDPDTADPAKMAAATQAMSNLITNTAQGTDLTQASLTTVVNAYADARATGVSDPQANFGYGLTSLALVAMQSADRLDLDLSDIDLGGGGDSGALRLVYYAASRLYLPSGPLAALSEGPGLVTREVLLPLDLASKGPAAVGRATYDDVSTEEVEAELRQHMIPALVAAREALAFATGSTSFAYDVPFQDRDDQNWTLQFRVAEARALAGVVDLLLSMVRVPLVYQGVHIDVEQPWTVTEAELADELLTPAEYLPAAPFGTLASDGTTQSRAILSSLRSATDHLIAAWASINASNTFLGQDLDSLPFLDGGGSDGGMSRALSATARGQITAALAELRAILAGRYTVDYAELEDLLDEDIDPAIQQAITHLNVPALLTNPPADLRSILPTFGEARAYDEETDSEYLYLLGHFEPPAWADPSLETTLGSWPVNANGRYTLGGLVEPGATQQQMLDALVQLILLRPQEGQSGVYRIELSDPEALIYG